MLISNTAYFNLNKTKWNTQSMSTANIFILQRRYGLILHGLTKMTEK